MKEKAVFVATMGLVGSGALSGDLPSGTIRSEEWKALRLLTLAGYTIVLFTPERSAVYAECRIADGSYKKDGETIYTTDIIANVFHKLDLGSRDDVAA